MPSPGALHLIAEDYIVGTANGMSRFDPKIHVVIEGAEFADYF